MDIIVGACAVIISGVLQECAATRRRDSRLFRLLSSYRRAVKLIAAATASINAFAKRNLYFMHIIITWQEEPL